MAISLTSFEPVLGPTPTVSLKRFNFKRHSPQRSIHLTYPRVLIEEVIIQYLLEYSEEE